MALAQPGQHLEVLRVLAEALHHLPVLDVGERVVDVGELLGRDLAGREQALLREDVGDDHRPRRGAVPRRHRQQVPGGVRQPLLSPAPVVVGAGHRVGQVEVDAQRVAEAAGDAVHDPARRVRVLVRAEEQVVGVAPAVAVQHGGVEGVEPQDPVELILGVGAQARREGGVAGEVGQGQAGSEGERAQPRVLTLPPGRGVGVGRIEEAGVADAGLGHHALPRITEGVRHLGGQRQLGLQRLAHDGQHGLLPRLVAPHHVEVRDEAHHRQAGVGRVEERALLAVRAEVADGCAVARPTPHQALRAGVRRGLVLRLGGGQEQLAGGQQRAVVVDDVLLAVVREQRVVLRQEGPGVLGRPQVVGLALPGRAHGRRPRQGGDGQAGPRAQAGLIPHVLQAQGASGLQPPFPRLRGQDGEAARVASDAAVLRPLARPRRGHRAVERPFGRLHAHQVVGSPGAFVHQAPQVLAEGGVAALLQQVVRLEQAPGGEGELLRVEVGREGEVGEVLAVVAGRVVPAAVRVHARTLRAALEGQRAVGLVQRARGALSLEVVEDVRQRVPLEHVLPHPEGERARLAGHQPVASLTLQRGEVERPVVRLTPARDLPGGLRGAGQHALAALHVLHHERRDRVARASLDHGALGAGEVVAEVVGEDRGRGCGQDGQEQDHSGLLL